MLILNCTFQGKKAKQVHALRLHKTEIFSHLKQYQLTKLQNNQLAPVKKQLIIKVKPQKKKKKRNLHIATSVQLSNQRKATELI